MSGRKARDVECGHSRRRHYASGKCQECYERDRRADPHYRAKQAQWRSRNPEYARARHVARYGLTLEQDKALGQRCNICGRNFRKGGAGVCVRGGRCIDHDHATGRVRGVLCRECNLGVASFRDDPALLVRAAEYLR